MEYGNVFRQSCVIKVEAPDRIGKDRIGEAMHCLALMWQSLIRVVFFLLLPCLGIHSSILFIISVVSTFIHVLCVRLTVSLSLYLSISSFRSFNLSCCCCCCIYFRLIQSIPPPMYISIVGRFSSI